MKELKMENQCICKNPVHINTVVDVKLHTAAHTLAGSSIPTGRQQQNTHTQLD